MKYLKGDRWHHNDGHASRVKGLRLRLYDCPRDACIAEKQLANNGVEVLRSDKPIFSDEVVLVLRGRKNEA